MFNCMSLVSLGKKFYLSYLITQIHRLRVNEVHNVCKIAKVKNTKSLNVMKKHE